MPIHTKFSECSMCCILPNVTANWKTSKRAEELRPQQALGILMKDWFKKTTFSIAWWWPSLAQLLKTMCQVASWETKPTLKCPFGELPSILCMNEIKGRCELPPQALGFHMSTSKGWELPEQNHIFSLVNISIIRHPEFHQLDKHAE